LNSFLSITVMFLPHPCNNVLFLSDICSFGSTFFAIAVSAHGSLAGKPSSFPYSSGNTVYHNLSTSVYFLTGIFFVVLYFDDNNFCYMPSNVPDL